MEKESCIEKHWFNILNEHPLTNILLICADEIIELTYLEQIKLLQSKNTAFSRKNLIGQYALKGGGWGINQDMQVRFFKNPKLKNEIPTVHCLPFQTNGCFQRSNLVIHHKAYDSVSSFIQRFNRYTSEESNHYHKKNTIFYLLFRTLKHFFKRYIIQCGFKDGAIGLALCSLMSLYFLISYVKSKES